MTCTDLAGTGGPVLSLLALGAVTLVLGLALVVLVRRRRSRVAVGLVLLLAGVAITIGFAASARATPVCVPNADNQVTITQTSVLTGLAPGVAPAPISGVIHNRGDKSPVITAVTVSIAGVATATSSPEGACDASDYLLSAPRMPVGRTLGPDESAAFSGAKIQFNDKSVNQDACKGARVNLRYVSY